MKETVVLPAIWLILLVAGLPQLSETAYAPSLPTVAGDFKITHATAELTLTVFLAGFAAGTLFWGWLSDRWGRKPCILIGLILFAAGCQMCYLAQHIEILMAGRVLQAFGGSIGSVLGQAVCRDSFQGSKLGQVYSFLGSALALFPALGPVVGGIIAQTSTWKDIFLFLMGFAGILLALIVLRLPETHHKNHRQHHPLGKVLTHLITDKHVLGLTLIVAAANGIYFSYFAESSFYLMKILHLSSLTYSISFVLIAGCAMSGGLLSNRLNRTYPSLTIMHWGIQIMSGAASLFCVLALLKHSTLQVSDDVMVAATISCQMITMFGFCMTVSNALAAALVNYQWCVGTASSLFGFFYCTFVALATLGMGLLHNGTLLPMPLYFFSLCMVMQWVSRKMVHGISLQTSTI